MSKYQWVPTDTAGAERLLAEKDERIAKLEQENRALMRANMAAEKRVSETLKQLGEAREWGLKTRQEIAELKSDVARLAEVGGEWQRKCADAREICAELRNRVLNHAGKVSSSDFEGTRLPWERDE